MQAENENKYREMVVRFREIQQRFEIATTIEDRKTVLTEMQKLCRDSARYLRRIVQPA